MKDTDGARARPPRRASRGPHAFDAELISRLLAELDQRLRRRAVAASVFIVGGAAIAVSGLRGDRLTEDVDALTRDDTDQEIALLAQDAAHMLRRNADHRAAPPE